MRRYFPSFTSLRCFEAASRYLNFTRAGEELNLTQSAVSRQIRNLEDFLRQELFLRTGKQLILTPVGLIYAKEVQEILNRLEVSTIHIMSSAYSDNTLEVGTLPTFGSRWLAPKLSSFSEIHPEIRLNLHTKMTAFDFTNEAVDVAIQYGGGSWAGTIAHQIMEEQLVVVCTPELIDSHRQVSPADVVRYSMLQVASRPRDWAIWMQEKGVEVRHQPNGPTFEHFSMMMQAALAGMGLALMPKIFVEDDLDSGRLITPFGSPIKSGKGYYIVYPEGSAKLAKVLAFRDWVLLSN